MTQKVKEGKSMKAKELIELIRENEAENHEVYVLTKDGERLELNSLAINPSKETIALGNE